VTGWRSNQLSYDPSLALRLNRRKTTTFALPFQELHATISADDDASLQSKTGISGFGFASATESAQIRGRFVGIRASHERDIREDFSPPGLLAALVSVAEHPRRDTADLKLISPTSPIVPISVPAPQKLKHGASGIELPVEKIGDRVRHILLHCRLASVSAAQLLSDSTPWLNQISCSNTLNWLAAICWS